MLVYSPLISLPTPPHRSSGCGCPLSTNSTSWKHERFFRRKEFTAWRTTGIIKPSGGMLKSRNGLSIERSIRSPKIRGNIFQGWWFEVDDLPSRGAGLVDPYAPFPALTCRAIPHGGIASRKAGLIVCLPAYPRLASGAKDLPSACGGLG